MNAPPLPIIILLILLVTLGLQEKQRRSQPVEAQPVRCLQVAL